MYQKFRRILNALLLIFGLCLLILPFQNCSNQKLKTLSRFNGGGEVYPGQGEPNIKFVVQSPLCNNGSDAYVMIKIAEEANYILIRDNCKDTSILIAPQELEWIVEGVSFNYNGYLYELKLEDLSL